jgi:hypothetical protein
MSTGDGSAFLDPIPGIIPFGTLTVFAGAPGVGKTAMLADWIQRWRKGREIWGCKTNPPNQFAYIAGDRHWASHAEWFEAAGFPEIPHYSIVDDLSIDPAEYANAGGALELFDKCLNRAADGYPPVPGALVVVDPAIPLFIAGNQNSPRDVARSLVTMARTARKRLYTLIVVGHFGKQKADAKDQYLRPQDRIAGSYAFSGFSDTQIYLIAPEEQRPFYMLGWNPRHQAPQEFACARDTKTGLFIPYDVIAEDKVASEVWDCFEATGPTTRAVILDRVRERHGYSDATIKRALSRLLDEHRIAKLGRGRYAKVKIH